MKSQMSIEFITGLSIMLFIYALTFSVYSNYTEKDITLDEQLQQKCYTVSNYIDSAVIGRENFSLNASLPYFIEGKNYSVYIGNDSTITVYVEDILFACSANSQDIKPLTLDGGKISITNINKTIFISRLDTTKLTYSLGESVNLSGRYFVGNVTLNILNEGVTEPGYPKTVEVTNYSFNEAFTPSGIGTYTITAKDTIQKNLNAEREIKIV